MPHLNPGPGLEKCTCTDRKCRGLILSKAVIDKLGLTLAAGHMVCNTLKQIGGLTQVPGLAQGAGALLVIITGLQDMKEVKGGFKDIIIDTYNLMRIVYRRIKENGVDETSSEMKRAAKELERNIVEIKTFCEAMQDRSGLRKFINSGMDKAKVGEWRTKFERAHQLFALELVMGNNAKAAKSSKDIQEILDKLRRDEERPNTAANYEGAPQDSSQTYFKPSPPQHQQSYDVQANSYGGYGQQTSDPQNQQGYDQGGYYGQSQYQNQWPQGNNAQWQQNEQQNYWGENYEEPQHYEDQHSHYGDYPQGNGQQYYNNADYPQYPHRQWTSPQPQFSPPASSAGRSYTIGSVMNGNFGDNHGLIVQGS
ncbi:hypothetical protein DFP72DRAFT_1044003 [Ephemerocybe angulata]|uniref:Uncharacterized protein n=1 Tax=Ephemerocybe angulata TaxID=980116 RepID=A0A8H6M7S8_9AGAR|nr:hypothetical protein DFP72DRAFT_1044003 [Tulosesus angulatus]